MGGRSRPALRSLAPHPVRQGAPPRPFARLPPLRGPPKILPSPGEMGEDSARAAGLTPIVVGSILPGHTTADDTLAAAKELRRQGARLILFAGGDGTARDVYRAIGGPLPGPRG